MTEQQAIDKLVSWCNGEVGYREGENNWNKYAEGFDAAFGWHIQNKPWCDIFVKRGFVDCFGNNAAAALIYEKYGSFSAGCAVSADYFKRAGAWSNTPQLGAQVFFIVSGGINHTGIVTKVGMGAIETVEGNSSDMVARRNYAIGDSRIAGYGIPKWSVVADYATVADQSENPTSSEIPVSDSKNPNNCEATEKLPILRKGMTGECVRAAQMLLNGRDCYVGRDGCDGDFGNNTLAAALAFQRRNGLEADGVIGKQTWSKLLGIT